jgi:hypothetical protein
VALAVQLAELLQRIPTSHPAARAG